MSAQPAPKFPTAYQQGIPPNKTTTTRIIIWAEKRFLCPHIILVEYHFEKEIKI
jgi:hypothetical protein